MGLSRSELISLGALTVSICALLSSYQQGVASRIETIRPRLYPTAKMIEKSSPDRSFTGFDVSISATNTGQSPARNIRLTAKLVSTNSLRYAVAMFLNGPFCRALAFDMTTTVYPGEETGLVFSLSGDAEMFLLNPQTSYYSDGTIYDNQSRSEYLFGCLSYEMDGVSKPFVEPIFRHVVATCGSTTKSCLLSDQKEGNNEPVSISLEGAN